ncbi:MAG: hypothetical protein ATN36_05620 [Epulopiscium sp. Nele67-Bin005]|nr:MAG: hypothetical protein ATN36_05620 [Epulopiscium sp. Nele67-Bin005]
MFVNIDNVPYYKVSNAQKLAPFFIQVVSSNDIWLFMSSNGGVTAGRKNSTQNIFPYTTNDKLNLDYETGSKTIVKIDDIMWQPFEQGAVAKYDITRNIYKSCYSNSVILEEVNHDLQLTYSYKYESSEIYGIVKTSKFTNAGESREVEILDGLSNILPYGVNQTLQNDRSTLVDAYKASELEGDRLAIYSLTTTINDTPNPIEMMKANVAYNTLSSEVHLNPDVVRKFIAGEKLDMSRETYGTKSGYFINHTAKINSGENLQYSFILDVGYDHSQIERLIKFVEEQDFTSVFENINQGTANIIEIVQKADGIQTTGDEVMDASHYVNTLYNVMRGGLFEDGYNFDYKDFEKFVKIRIKNFVVDEEVKNCKTIDELKEICTKNPVLNRLALEYMPLTFSRRHGDPSRPWNKFNIDLKDEQGNRKISYEGNWRDIFQNWEALGLSFPQYYENMVAKFVNASTIDGYNPYRINTEGIDWEKPDPEDPFSGIGYWGDHQIIYLLRLLEGLNNHYPEKLNTLMSKEIFSYANVPYIIRPYEDILKNPKSTILFDEKKDLKIDNLVTKFGTDAKLLMENEQVVTVSLAEKLLVPVLSKLSNLMVGGGIWMNTERPEWNDANNAIVGIGLSMITVYHISAYLDFVQKLFVNDNYNVSESVANWLVDTKAVFEKYDGNFAQNEKILLDELGEVFSNYREVVYKNGVGNKVSLAKSDILDWIKIAKGAITYTIEQNKNDVFVSYNLLGEDFSVTPMRDMLEGQSAIIGSGYLDANQTCDLINNMSKNLYSDTLKAHTLYPVVMTRRFTHKNTVNTLKEISGIIVKDINGKLHFDSSIVTEEILRKKCELLGLCEDETSKLIVEFERLFGHKKFNGRSEVFYKFEGIGCVYWHQNAKFALAILETIQRAEANGEDISKIYDEYHKILQGFIFRKTPEQCGAIPIEPYSHSSFIGSSEQPGMTGQVKESVIMRRGELGVKVGDGIISFNPKFLRESEFDSNGEIAFMIYGTSVKYVKSDVLGAKILFRDKTSESVQNYTLSKEISKSIFDKNSNIEQIILYV